MATSVARELSFDTSSLYLKRISKPVIIRQFAAVDYGSIQFKSWKIYFGLSYWPYYPLIRPNEKSIISNDYLLPMKLSLEAKDEFYDRKKYRSLKTYNPNGSHDHCIFTIKMR